MDVLNRFKHILSFSSKIRVNRAFIMPHLTYCSSVWNSCLKEDSDRLERLHERALETTSGFKFQKISSLVQS